jgi:ribosome biogenesis GTPase / thiamine phosphate phosphatase
MDAGLRAIGWRDDIPAARAWQARHEGRLARVVAQHRSGYRVTDGLLEFPVQSPAQWARPGLLAEERAAVGDWVRLDPAHDTLIELLPRQSLLRRGAAGEHYKQQLIAANVDTVLVVVGLDHDFNPRRLERYLLLVRGSGGEPVFVLTKADRCDDVDAARAALAGLEDGGCPLVAINAKDPASIAALEPWLGPGRTLVLVGSSGAGKSTLTNTLLGRQQMKTAEVRERDSRGRHTTTHRSLIPLPGGACLIDTPGMRELKLTGEEELAEGGFEDVDALTGECRFRDCRHAAEPGCAVRAAIDDGRLAPGRWASYCKLHGEIAAAGQSLAAQRARRAESPTGRPPAGRHGKR